MAHKIGLHWLRVHPDGGDFAHIERMQYPSAKLFEWHWSDRDACASLLSVLPASAYILARDHPMSEQKEAMWADPVGAGTRHANEWAEKVQTGRYHLPTDRSFFLGINEPDATNGDRSAIDRYTTAFLDRLRQHGLRGGAFNFSTGHPRTVDGTPNTQADYTVFEGSRQAIVRGHHIAVAHIYGTAAVPLAPGHYDRLRSCPWQDVEWVVGEFGIDEHVIGGGEHHGYLVPFADNPATYCGWLDGAIMGIADPRIHSYQVFTYDYSKPWDSFDVRVVRSALESYPWREYVQPVPQPHNVYVPIVGGGPTQPKPQQPAPRALAWPCAGVVTQRFGENPANYARFGLPGHNGLDIGAPQGTSIRAVAEGEVVWVDTDPDYGNYVRVYHQALGFHSFYAHLSSAGCAVGQHVKQGQEIGKMGSTGNSTGPHLHLEIRLGSRDDYGQATFGHSKGRVDPETVYSVLGKI